MRAEPNHYAAAAQVLADPALTDDQRRLAARSCTIPS